MYQLIFSQTLKIMTRKAKWSVVRTRIQSPQIHVHWVKTIAGNGMHLIINNIAYIPLMTISCISNGRILNHSVYP